LDLLGQVQQFQLSAVPTHRRVVCYQLADATGVDVFNTAQVEQNLFLAAVNQAANRVAE
jgi:hypothetical protein